ncbi:NlpC/P60 family protein [Streptomyces sp. NPDC086023]|uniref:C40 family peptidase n=1 Tax=Streptomyces sp. NPDC086023 TaxID=3365746 RepID=UPI0037D7D521
MPGRLLRLVCAAATTSVALALATPTPVAAGTGPRAALRAPGPAGPGAEDAYGTPGEPGPGAAPYGGDTAGGGSSETDGTAAPAAATADVTPVDAPTSDGTGPAGGPAAGDGSVAGLLRRLQGLYQKAEEASEAYNATEVTLKASQAEERRLSGELGKARNALGATRAAAGRLARSQYQGSAAFSPYVRMLLSGSPQQAVDERRLARREAAHQARLLARLTGAEKQAGALATRARKALDAQQTLAAQRKKQRDEVNRQLAEVQRLLASLSAEQIAALTALEKAGDDKAQKELEDSGRLGEGKTTRNPTSEGGRALAYAVEQIGKPYVWGAEGPASFDCSGLTSQAWAHAGRSIPRTSQEQWAQLPRVPLDRLRPGDLVLYFPKATHVALYIGGGKVIQAPRPGAKVKVSPIAANPLLGAVRPDPLGEPLAEFSPPPLPAQGAAEAGSGEGADGDAGYSSEEAPSSDDAPSSEEAPAGEAAGATEADTSAR